MVRTTDHRPRAAILRQHWQLLATLAFGGALLFLGLLLRIPTTTSAATSTTTPARSQPITPQQVVSEDIATDTTWSGSISVTYHIKVENNATLTIEPGTRVNMCEGCTLRASVGMIQAEGTASDPIVFAASEPGTKWGSLLIGGTASKIYTSTLRYVELENGGGNDQTANNGALFIDAYSGTEGVGPTIDHVTIRKSNNYGAVVDIEDSDRVRLSNLTIMGSAKAPLYIAAAAMNHLSGENTYTNNGTIYQDRGNVIEVWDTTFYDSQTIPRQSIPYELTGGFGVERRDGAQTTVITVETGTDFLLRENASIDFNSNILIAEGTAENPITFDAADPAKPWEAIYFGGSGGTAQPAMLRYVTLSNGGGVDDLSDPMGGRGMIDIYDLNGTEKPGPSLDHVTIRNSTSYGIFIDIDDEDDTPPTLSNLSISGTTRAPIGMYAAAAKGLGSGHTFSNNTDNTIEIRAGTVVGGRIYHDQTWQTQTIPYHLVSDFGVVDVKNGATLTIEAGNTLLIDEGMGFRVGGGGALVVRGTPTQPVTFTRTSENSPNWGNILLGRGVNESRISHATLLYGGNESPAIEHDSGSLTLEHVTVQHSNQAGVYSSGQFILINDSTIQFNREGVRIEYDTNGLLRHNTISDNIDAGLVIANNGNICVDAMQNYWGSPDGPADSSSAQDNCGSTATNNGTGNSISDGALYRPWLRSADGGAAQDASNIVPDQFWMIADGLKTAELTVLVRDAQGNPLPNKEIELETTVGTITQPASPTNADGLTTAHISSTVTGNAIVTGRNVSDGTSLSSMAAIRFWQGRGDYGGLIEARGAPYASPHLIVEGKPAQQGFPMTFRFPMQNTNAVPIDVTVAYGISGLGLGQRFTTVDTRSATLQPGESWDAAGGWVPDVTGHHCIQATIAFTIEDEARLQRSGTQTDQQNEDVDDTDDDDDPCDDPNVWNLVPTKFGLGGVRKHTRKATKEANKVGECIESINLSQVARNASLSQNGEQRDYERVVEVADYTAPLLEPGEGVSTEQAEAANGYAQANADLAALNEALDTTDRRIQQAVRADDFVAANMQYAAYVGFQQQRAQALDHLADQIDSLLAVTEGAGEDDILFTPQDYQAYLEQLQTTGFSSETLSFLQATGLSDERIEELRHMEIYILEHDTATPTTYYALLGHERDTARERADTLRERYGSAQLAQTDGAVRSYPADKQSFSFMVGNPTDGNETVNLFVRPVNLPAGWTYALDEPAPTLDAGATTEVALTLTPGSERVWEGTEVRVGVEGFINGDYIGGVMLGTWVPGQDYVPDTPVAELSEVYLPLVVRD